MNRRKNVSVEDAVKASTFLEEGYSMRYVANLLGRNHSTISRMVGCFNQTGSYNRRPGQGRKRSKDARDGRFLRQSALRNRTVTGTMLKNELAIAHNVMISSRTVRKRLNEAGLSILSSFALITSNSTLIGSNEPTGHFMQSSSSSPIAPESLSDGLFVVYQDAESSGGEAALLCRLPFSILVFFAETPCLVTSKNRFWEACILPPGSNDVSVMCNSIWFWSSDNASGTNCEVWNSRLKCNNILVMPPHPSTTVANALTVL
ncbi:hypothetical protein ILUMI_25781 [Ignelater luminosus]|uniref:Transposase IS30-like HTH domain-containing protein n=1 Tax=Ignelater luminosus TaxID=2038154 RepID=A0A8K0C9A4_IGNLU|nr:hypothetical protein ILUMI_25781 [Ignelater luminosus]